MGHLQNILPKMQWLLCRKYLFKGVMTTARITKWHSDKLKAQKKTLTLKLVLFLNCYNILSEIRSKWRLFYKIHTDKANIAWKISCRKMYYKLSNLKLFLFFKLNSPYEYKYFINLFSFTAHFDNIS